MNTKRASQPKIDRDPNKLAPFFIARLNAAIADCLSLGFQVAMFEGFRTPARQDWLYAQGRSRPGNIVTRAKAFESWHCFGLAADIAYKTPAGHWTWDGDFLRLVPIFKARNLQWLGAWDAGHYELHGKVSLKKAKIIYEREGLEAVWDVVKKESRQEGQ